MYLRKQQQPQQQQQQGQGQQQQGQQRGDRCFECMAKQSNFNSSSPAPSKGSSMMPASMCKWRQHKHLHQTNQPLTTGPHTMHVWTHLLGLTCDMLAHSCL
jgi:hypothetical protein